MTDYRIAMMGDLLGELIEDQSVQVSEISDGVMGQLKEIHDHHATMAERTALLISYLGG